MCTNYETNSDSEKMEKLINVGSSNCKHIVKMEVPDEPIPETCPQGADTWVSLRDMSLTLILMIKQFWKEMVNLLTSISIMHKGY